MSEEPEWGAKLLPRDSGPLPVPERAQVQGSPTRVSLELGGGKSQTGPPRTGCLLCGTLYK